MLGKSARAVLEQSGTPVLAALFRIASPIRRRWPWVRGVAENRPRDPAAHEVGARRLNWRDSPMPKKSVAVTLRKPERWLMPMPSASPERCGAFAEG